MKKRPQSVEDLVERNRLQRDWNAKYIDWIDDALDKGVGDPKWLQDSAIADLVAAAIHFRDAKVYNLLTFCIMPNHVHMLSTLQDPPVLEILFCSRVKCADRSFRCILAPRELRPRNSR